jgi:hypothetical protein
MRFSIILAALVLACQLVVPSPWGDQAIGLTSAYAQQNYGGDLCAFCGSATPAPLCAFCDSPRTQPICAFGCQSYNDWSYGGTRQWYNPYSYNPWTSCPPSLEWWRRSC